MKYLSVFCLCIFMASSCGDKDICDLGMSMKLNDLSGLDGCGWVLTLGSGEQLEPINLSEHVPNPVEDQIVNLIFEERTDMASTCQVGRIVEITCFN